MFDLLLGKFAAIPWYFWSLAFAWGAIEIAGWLRVRNSRKKRRLNGYVGTLSTEGVADGDPGVGTGAGMGARFVRWGLRRRAC